MTDLECEEHLKPEKQAVPQMAPAHIISFAQEQKPFTGHHCNQVLLAWRVSVQE